MRNEPASYSPEASWWVLRSVRVYAATQTQYSTELTLKLPSTTVVQTAIQSCYYSFDKQLDSLKQLRVMHLAQGYFDASSSFMLFNPIGCGGGINRFKSRWEEFCWKISTPYAHTYQNQRIFPRLKNWLFLSSFPRANLTYACSDLGQIIFSIIMKWWLFEVSPQLFLPIPYSTSNTIYGSHPPALYFQWLNSLRKEILSTFT